MKAVVRNHCQQDCERQYNERARLPGLQLSMPKSSSERRGWGGSFAVSGGRVTLPESSVRRTEQARPVICATEPAPAVGLLLLLWRRGSGRGVFRFTIIWESMIVIIRENRAEVIEIIWERVEPRAA